MKLLPPQLWCNTCQLWLSIERFSARMRQTRGNKRKCDTCERKTAEAKERAK